MECTIFGMFLRACFYHIYPKYIDKQAWTNQEDQGQMSENMKFDLGHQCLPLIQQF